MTDFPESPNVNEEENTSFVENDTDNKNADESISEYDTEDENGDEDTAFAEYDISTDFTEIPTRQGPASAICLTVFLALAAVCLVSRTIGITASVWIDALFVIFSVAAIFVLTSCFLTDYEYRLFCMDGRHIFAVNKIVGKKRTLLAAVELNQVIKVIEKKDIKTEKRPTVQKKLNYCKSLAPARCQRIYFNNRSDNISLCVELSPAALSNLNYRIELSKNHKH